MVEHCCHQLRVRTEGGSARPVLVTSQKCQASWRESAPRGRKPSLQPTDGLKETALGLNRPVAGGSMPPFETAERDQGLSREIAVRVQVSWRGSSAPCAPCPALRSAHEARQQARGNVRELARAVWAAAVWDAPAAVLAAPLELEAEHQFKRIE